MSETEFLAKLDLLHEFLKLHGLTIWGPTANGGVIIEEHPDVYHFVNIRIFGPDGWDATDEYSRDQLRASNVPRRPEE